MRHAKRKFMPKLKKPGGPITTEIKAENDVASNESTNHEESSPSIVSGETSPCNGTVVPETVPLISSDKQHNGIDASKSPLKLNAVCDDKVPAVGDKLQVDDASDSSVQSNIVPNEEVEESFPPISSNISHNAERNVDDLSDSEVQSNKIVEDSVSEDVPSISCDKSNSSAVQLNGVSSDLIDEAEIIAHAESSSKPIQEEQGLVPHVISDVPNDDLAFIPQKSVQLKTCNSSIEIIHPNEIEATTPTLIANSVFSEPIKLSFNVQKNIPSRIKGKNITKSPEVVSKASPKRIRKNSTNDKKSTKSSINTNKKSHEPAVDIQKVEFDKENVSNGTQNRKSKQFVYEDKEKTIFSGRMKEFRKKKAEGKLENSLTLFDVLHCAPEGEPMPKKTRNTKENDPRKKEANDKQSKATDNDKITESNLAEEEVTDDVTAKSVDSEEDREVAEEGSDDDIDISAPQIKVLPNGEVVLDNDSLFVKQVVDKTRLENLSKDIIEVDEFSRKSFGKKKARSKDWTPKELSYFYKILSMVGTDFSLMHSMHFKWRSRDELKKKFKKEEKIHPAYINQALKSITHASLYDSNLYDDEPG